ncbi:hypothetical protein BDD12DRAFT_550809 [Trichophaea hybrida]|nr:hypothetical protein BDD12DRAFT_550809 [Trichophaea hybrida]
MSEDHDALLSKIGQLAGQINRHKNQHEHVIRPAPSTSYRGGFGYNAPYRQY